MYKVVVFGLGKFGASVATRLYEKGAEVLAVDQDVDLVEEIQDSVSAAVAFNAASRTNLEAYSVGQMNTAVVAIGDDFEASVLITLLCKELGVPKIIAKALNPAQRRVLLAVGAGQVVLPEEEMGSRLADHLLHESVVDFVELPQGFSLRRIGVPEAWVGKTLAELQLLSEEKLNLIQIVRRPEPGDQKQESEPERIPLPHGPTQLLAGDRLDVIGPDKALDKYL